MDIKKKTSRDPEPADRVKEKDSKPLEAISSQSSPWPGWLPYGHGIFLLLLLLTLLLGYGLPYEKPELPQRDYRTNYGSTEEETVAVQEYEIKKEAYDKQKKAWDEGGEEARRGWIAAGRNLAKFSTVLWLVYTCLFSPS